MYKIFKIKILFYLYIGIVPHTFAQQSGAIYSRNNVDCSEPIVGEWFFFSNGGPRYPTLEGLISSLQSHLQADSGAGHNCIPKPNVEFVGSFEGVDTKGSGMKEASPRGRIVWTLSLHDFESRPFYGSNNEASDYPIVIHRYRGARCEDPISVYQGVTKTRGPVYCPEGYSPDLYEGGTSQEDIDRGNAVCRKFTDVVYNPLCCTTSNPIQISSGSKLRSEIDFTFADFTFSRHYHSGSLNRGRLGRGWHIDLFKRFSFNRSENQNGLYYFDLSKGNGTHLGFVRNNSNDLWQQIEGEATNISVEDNAGHVLVKFPDSRVEKYNNEGKLIEEFDRNGLLRSYEYDADNTELLIKVSNRYQQSIKISYNEKGFIESIIDPTNQEYRYEYDANDNLTAVVYPDSDTDPSNNPKRIYHYENPDFPNHITGITDANGERYATFAYGVDGKAIESALAPTTNPVGQQRVQLNYQGTN